MNDKYASILDLPHHVSPTRPQMSRRDRAAQFAPFAALAGYDAAIRETARTPETRPELDEYERLLFSDDGDDYDDDDFEDDTVYEKIPTEPKDSDSAPADAE